MGFIAIASLGLGICGVLLIGCGFTPGRSSARWGSAFHAEQHLDHLYSREWFEQFLAVVKQEQLGRAGGALVLAGLLLQQLAGLGRICASIPLGIGSGALAGAILSLGIGFAVTRLCRKHVARQVEILAVRDIESSEYTKDGIQTLLARWFKKLVGREACLNIEQGEGS